MAQESGNDIHKEFFEPWDKINDFTRPPFSDRAKEECAQLLRQLQRGEMLGMPQSRPMKEIATGCHELRVRDKNVNWRLMYYMDERCIVILKIFPKKTRKTPEDVKDVCQKRLRNFLDALSKADKIKKRK